MKLLKNLFYLFFPIILGSITGILLQNNTFNNTLNMPPFSPNRVLFPIVWSILYLLMGISYYLYKKEYRENNLVDFTYYLQLFVNIGWSFIFFLFKLRFLAIVWIILLLILVIILILLFRITKKISAYLNIPYLIWIIFATYLTVGIYILN